ncbi:MAG: hypothetical protein A3K10_10790 [Bacteroidetes bacterium RIFCSPLOWO2_12_FULL_31_6]|nr:MAG: hypothetical protein A3K10_10790 [Bacteroidetes bacterium RIFCSPLOWO2_12_FULL_31_6]
MSIELIEETIKRVEKNYRNILPFDKRDWSLESLVSTEIMAHTLNSKAFEDFVENWENFLSNIDKFWNQLNAYRKYHAKLDKKEILNGFLGNANKERTTDELLVYLDKARNSTQHTLWRHLRKSESIEVFAGKGAVIKFLPNGVQVTGVDDAAKQVTIMFKEGVILLKHIKVVEKGDEVIYELPTTFFNHKFSPMERVAPQIIGLYGLIYYKKLFDEYKSKC